MIEFGEGIEVMIELESYPQRGSQNGVPVLEEMGSEVGIREDS